ncbi:MAG: N-acetylneuraminate synthase family protein [Planctomycetota bacterium]
MHIGEREIGPRQPPYIIAEIGVNHDGSAERAVELTEAAAKAGADAIKLQLFETDRLMSKASRLAAYQIDAGESDPFAMLRRLELSIDGMAHAVRRAHELGVHAIVTVFSVELVAAAQRLPWDAYKSASPDIINRPLLEAMAGTGLPLIVSTGASTLDEVTRAADWLDGSRDRTAMLQCVSSYPAPDAALGGIRTIVEATRLRTGYSDHTASIETGAHAVAAGALLLERHITHDKDAAGPDHAASLGPKEFARYVRLARAASLGASFVEPGKRVLECERDVRSVSRQSLVATRDLPAGCIVQRKDLTIKRPGTGLAPWRLDSVIGRRIALPVDADTPLLESSLMPTAGVRLKAPTAERRAS